MFLALTWSTEGYDMYFLHFLTFSQIIILSPQMGRNKPPAKKRRNGTRCLSGGRGFAIVLRFQCPLSEAVR